MSNSKDKYDKYFISPNGYKYKRKGTFSRTFLDFINDDVRKKTNKIEYKPERILSLPTREEFIKNVKKHAK